jgi:cell division septation protein DedD
MLSILDLNSPPERTASAESAAAENAQTSPATAAAANAERQTSSSQQEAKDSAAEKKTGEKPYRAVPRMPPSEVKDAEPSAKATATSSVSLGDSPSKTKAAGAGAETSEAAQTPANGEFELVLGRRQIASCLFAGTLLVAIFASGSYFAGKMSAPGCAAAASMPAGIRIPAAPKLDASQLHQPKSVEETSSANAKQNGFAFVASTAESSTNAIDTSGDGLSADLKDVPTTSKNPLFANPQQGALYLQMGALDKNMSAIVAEGLRERGYNSFVAPGPSEKLFRVLIGPFASQDEYKRMKTETDTIDVNALAHETLTKRAVASK